MKSDAQMQDGGAIASKDLLGWLHGKLADAEQTLRSREQMANPPKISAEEWERIKAMPGVRITKGRKLSKAELKDLAEEPLRQKRIAIKCRHEVEMFKATIAALTQPNLLMTYKTVGFVKMAMMSIFVDYDRHSRLSGVAFGANGVHDQPKC